MKNSVTIFDRFTVYADGSIYLGEYRLPQYANSNGYLSVKIEGKFYQVHRIVASAFLSNDGKPYVNHKNGNRHDNSASNLEWVTPSENTRHAIERGTHFNLAKYMSERRMTFINQFR